MRCWSVWGGHTHTYPTHTLTSRCNLVVISPFKEQVFGSGAAAMFTGDHRPGPSTHPPTSLELLGLATTKWGTTAWVQDGARSQGKGVQNARHGHKRQETSTPALLPETPSCTQHTPAFLLRQWPLPSLTWLLSLTFYISLIPVFILSLSVYV